MHRGGHPNPVYAAYDAEHHTVEQLRDLFNDPEITLVVGDLVTEETVAAAEAAVAKKPAKK